MWNLGKTNSAKPWWNHGETFAEPWSNLPRNLLAAQHGSAPENHGESESKSAPKPLLWLKTQTLLLLVLFPNKNFMSAIPEQTRQWLGAAQSQFAACRCPQAVPNRWEVPGVV